MGQFKSGKSSVTQKRHFETVRTTHPMSRIIADAVAGTSVPLKGVVR
jgi:hypothetical protein